MTWIIRRNLFDPYSCSAEEMHLKLRFYGKLAEQLGAEKRFTPPEGTDTVEKLRQVLGVTYPDLAAEFEGRSLVFLGDQMVANDHAILEDETVEFLPPLSGG